MATADVVTIKDAADADRDIDSVDVGSDIQRQVWTIGDHTTRSTYADVTAKGLATEIRQARKPIRVTSGGLSTGAGYAAGEQVGTLFTFANAARYSGGTGLIEAITILDKNDVITTFNVHIYKDSVTLASDNAAYAVSDTDQEQKIAMVPMAPASDDGGNRWAQAQGLGIPFDCVGTSLYVALQTVIAINQFAATTDLIVTLWVVQD